MMSQPKLPIILIADNIRSLYNVGSLFRVADGVNLEAIYLCGMTGYPMTDNDPRPIWVAERADKEIRKTGLAGVNAVPFQYFETTEAAIADVKTKGYQAVGLELAQDSVAYRSFPYRFPLAVVIGHETDGVADSILKQLDGTVHLPMHGQGKSLNVSTAAAAFLYYIEDRHTNH